MARNTQFYSQADVTCTVDGEVMTDFGDGDDVIGFEWEGDRTSLTQGLDSSRISFASIRGGRCTLKLKPTSPQVGFLNKIWEDQKTSPRLVDIRVQSGTRELMSLLSAGLKNKDTYNTGGPTMQMRGFTFEGEEIIDDITQG